MKLNFSKVTLIALLSIIISGCTDSEKDKDDFELTFNNQGVLKRVLEVAEDETTTSVSIQSLSKSSANSNLKVVARQVLSLMEDESFTNPINGYIIKDAVFGDDRLIFTITDDVEAMQTEDFDDVNPPLFSYEYKEQVGCKIFQVMNGTEEITCFSNIFDNDTLYLPLGIFHEGFYFLYVNESMYRLDADGKNPVQLTEYYRLNDIIAHNNTILFQNEGPYDWRVLRNALADESEMTMTDINGSNYIISENETVIARHGVKLNYHSELGFITEIDADAASLVDDKTNKSYFYSRNGHYLFNILNPGEVVAEINPEMANGVSAIWDGKILWPNKDDTCETTACTVEFEVFNINTLESNTICTKENAQISGAQVISTEDVLVIKYRENLVDYAYCGFSKVTGATFDSQNVVKVSEFILENVATNEDYVHDFYTLQSDIADINYIDHVYTGVLAVTLTMHEDIDLDSVGNALAVTSDGAVIGAKGKVVDLNKITFIYEENQNIELVLDKTLLLDHNGEPIEFSGDALIIKNDIPLIVPKQEPLLIESI